MTRLLNYDSRQPNFTTPSLATTRKTCCDFLQAYGLSLYELRGVDPQRWVMHLGYQKIFLTSLKVILPVIRLSEPYKFMEFQALTFKGREPK